MKLQVTSLNVRGLGEAAKRRQIFHYFNINSFNIIFLQETHCTKTSAPYWISEWGHKMYSSFGTKDSRGVSILIKNNCSHTVHKCIVDKDGRSIILDISFDDIRLTLVNLYGPNLDNPAFFENIIEQIENIPNDNRIIGGDFNLVLDNSKDKKGGSPIHSNKLSQKAVLSWMENGELTDIWRFMHPDKKSFTWSRKKPYPIFCRLDFFLIAQSMKDYVKETSIRFGIKSDHALIEMSLETRTIKRAAGFWKFNTSLLKDDRYVKLTKETIQETVLDNPNTEPPLLWDTIKCKIRGMSIKYSFQKSKTTKNELKELEEKINKLQSEVEILPDEKLLEELENLKSKYYMLERKTQGAILRSKCRYAEYGEKNTAYFLNIEKRNYNRKSMNKIQLENNEISESPQVILSELEKFYTNLYSAEALIRNPQVVNTFLKDLPKLTDEQSNSCEGMLTEAEIFRCLNSFSNNKSPGTDGLSSEWYKFFWEDIKLYLLNSLNFIAKNGKMSISQRQGILTLIPKKDKNPLLVKNWRPISLLNLDYKLIAKCIANRIKPVLSNIIHADQTGFLKNRYIGENLIKTIALMDFSQSHSLNSYLITIDFEKAFDFLDKQFIFQCLGSLNFGPDILNWIKILYNDVSSCVINNGAFSKFFPVNRGVRQGCPLSPYIFIIAVETLALQIRNNKLIKAIEVNGIHHIISQYADDTSLVAADPVSIKEILNVFEDFRSVSGLKLNKDKTVVMPMTEHTVGKQEIINLGLNWSEGPVNLLGIVLYRNLSETCNANYTSKLEKLKQVIYAWKHRKLTLMGKIVVLKSHILSQLIYVLSVLPSPSCSYVKEVEQIVFNFLWDGRNDKIKREIIYAPRDMGGLNMMHIPTQIKALKIIWVKRLMTGPRHSGWRQLIDHQLCNKTDLIFSCNLSLQDTLQTKLQVDRFWHDVLMSWCEFNFEPQVECDETIIKQSLWFNSHLKQNNKVLFIQKLYSKGIFRIEHLLDTESNKFKFLSQENIFEKYGVHINFLEYASLMHCIPKKWSIFIKNMSNMCNNPKITLFMNNIEKMIVRSSNSRYIYDILIQKIYRTPKRILLKWKNEISVEDSDVFLSFKNLYKCTSFVKLRTFQFKLLHRNLALNDYLYNIGIVDSNRCTFCFLEKETILHTFFDCYEVKNLWLQLYTWLKSNNILLPTLSADTIILGLPDKSFDIIILATKYYIYLCRCLKQNLSLTGLKAYLRNIYVIERNIAQKNFKMSAHDFKWKALGNLLYVQK